MPNIFEIADTGLLKLRNGDEAMAVLLHEETNVDVVFSDIEMPGSVDGFGLAKWIGEHRLRAVNAAKELCDGNPLPKPYTSQAVHDRIRRLLAARKAARSTKE